MKHIAFILSSFCILLLAGCRNTTSLQEEKTTKKATQSCFKQTVIQMSSDSIDQRMVMSAESLYMELPLLLTEDSLVMSSKPKPKVVLKAYGISLRTKQSQSTDKQVVTKIEGIKTSVSQKTKERNCQKTKSNKVFMWVSACSTLFLLVCIAYRISRR